MAYIVEAAPPNSADVEGALTCLAGSAGLKPKTHASPEAYTS